MAESVKEVTTDLDCVINTRPDLCAKKLRQKRVQRVEKVTALMTARSKSGSSQEPEEEEDSGSEEDDLGKGSRSNSRSELDNWDPNQRRSGRKLRPRKNLEYVKEEKTQPNWKVLAELDGSFKCERHPVNHEFETIRKNGYLLVEVRKSLVPGDSGQGLFAKKKIKLGAVVCSYCDRVTMIGNTLRRPLWIIEPRRWCILTVRSDYAKLLRKVCTGSDR
jgi:hypothetical protein